MRGFAFGFKGAAPADRKGLLDWIGLGSGGDDAETDEARAIALEQASARIAELDDMIVNQQTAVEDAKAALENAEMWLKQMKDAKWYIENNLYGAAEDIEQAIRVANGLLVE